MYSVCDTITLLMVSSLIRISTDHGLFATPRSFSQLVTSFFGAMYQGILLYALCSLIYFGLHKQSRRITFSLILDYTRLILLVNSSYAFFKFVLTIRFKLVFLCLLYYLIKVFSRQYLLSRINTVSLLLSRFFI